MTLFIDASAIVAVIAEEEDAAIYAGRIAEDDQRLTSAIAIWEATIAVARRGRTSIEDAAEAVRGYVAGSSFGMVAIQERETLIAIDAFARYGKGVDRAGLNMGDCFAYACAKANHARLLYKGKDFDLTDLAWSDNA
ncbi:type II toxin-antitoxin system VapC family toxin [Sphingomonas gilva]|uniref:Ribonuclease VapC n=1 Tax=Sphingomonas gilva TaxID=2305907 RepID=A0A396S4D6_9SPHN|nr:type II toxin-antitoxin system VapC family toxin [Sphingomonas gilva]RHW18285.1 type II toxin-antitoxin system VapC family toxin [Sphingomonas gilva]